MQQTRKPANRHDTAMNTWIRVGVVAAIFAQAVFGQAVGTQSSLVVQQAEQLIAAHQLEKANELLTDYAQRNPSDGAVLEELGNVQLAQGLTDDAMKSFEAVLESHPGSTAARDGEVKAATSAALADNGAGLPGYALAVLVRARKVVPDSPELLLDIGIQEEGMRIFHDADETLRKARELAPQNTKILYALAHVELDEQKMPEAEADLRAYLKEQPNDATAHYGLGKLLHMELKNDEAKAELEHSIALEPRQSASYYELGEIALEQEQNQDAKVEFEKVLSLAPHHGGALTGMGILAYRAKDYPAAEGFLKDAVLNAPDYPAAHHYYALVLARLGLSDEARNEAALATKLDEEQARTRAGNFLTVIH
ncbi:MAG TPA: tetratricopeptide repeat protein [Terracidiphilus sp.]|nr:tetratricopeptide repeat protein [Terracidiphilus sp.]